MTGHAFISYSRIDGGYVEKLVTHLADANISLWYDHSIPSGARFDRFIDERIQQCGAFLVVMTPAGYDSDWVANELSRAQQLHKPILPLLLAGRPFISLSSRDYENVLGGVMPSPRFMRTLREYLGGAAAAHTSTRADPPVGKESPELEASGAVVPMVGDKFIGRVVRIAVFGAFISLLPGHDGLLHISKMGDGKRVDKVEDFLNIGDAVEVSILDIDKRGKIYLDRVRPEDAGGKRHLRL